MELEYISRILNPIIFDLGKVAADLDNRHVITLRYYNTANGGERPGQMGGVV